MMSDELRYNSLTINVLQIHHSSFQQFPLWQKTFQKLQTFGKLIFDLWLFYLKNAQNTEGVLWILTPNFPKRKLLSSFIIHHSSFIIYHSSFIIHHSSLNIPPSVFNPFF
jgi:hypothetical protein